MAEQKHVVVGITGSVAVSHSPDILKGLQDQGIKVSVVMTKNAEQFIPSGSFADILDGNVFTDMFVPASEEKQMPHISLAKEADALLIAPATSNIIGKMAH